MSIAPSACKRGSSTSNEHSEKVTIGACGSGYEQLSLPVAWPVGYHAWCMRTWPRQRPSLFYYKLPSSSRLESHLAVGLRCALGRSMTMLDACIHGRSNGSHRPTISSRGPLAWSKNLAVDRRYALGRLVKSMDISPLQKGERWPGSKLFETGLARRKEQ